MKHSLSRYWIILLIFLGLVLGCSRESTDTIATNPTQGAAVSSSTSASDAATLEDDSGGPIQSSISDSNDSLSVGASSVKADRMGSWVIAAENRPFLDSSSDGEESYLTTENGVTEIRLPRGAADQHIILNQPLLDDFEVKVRIRWPNWETSGGSPRIKFGLCNDQGRMQKFSQRAWFSRSPKEHYEFLIRCSGGGVELVFDSDRERSFEREFDGQTYFAFSADAPALFEIVEQSIAHGPHEIEFNPTRRITYSNGSGTFAPGMFPPGMGPPGMVPPGAIPPGMRPPGLNGNVVPSTRSEMGNAAFSSQSPSNPINAGQPFPPKNTRIPRPMPGPISIESTPWRIFGGEEDLANLAAAASSVKRVGKHYQIDKASSTPDFWLLRGMPETDWEATLTFDLPATSQLRSQAAPGILGIGMFSTDLKNGMRLVAPNPAALTRRRVEWGIRRQGDSIEYQIDGGSFVPVGVSMKGKSEIGFWVAGMISFQFDVRNLSGTAFDSDQSAKDGANSKTMRIEAMPSMTRVWSDASGKFQVKATFVAMDSNILILKKADGKLAKVPLERLSKKDQKAAKLLAEIDSSD